MKYNNLAVMKEGKVLFRVENANYSKDAMLGFYLANTVFNDSFLILVNGESSISSNRPPSWITKRMWRYEKASYFDTVSDRYRIVVNDKYSIQFRDLSFLSGFITVSNFYKAKYSDYLKYLTKDNTIYFLYGTDDNTNRYTMNDSVFSDEVLSSSDDLTDDDSFDIMDFYGDHEEEDIDQHEDNAVQIDDDYE